MEIEEYIMNKTISNQALHGDCPSADSPFWYAPEILPAKYDEEEVKEASPEAPKGRKHILLEHDSEAAPHVSNLSNIAALRWDIRSFSDIDAVVCAVYIPSDPDASDASSDLEDDPLDEKNLQDDSLDEEDTDPQAPPKKEHYGFSSAEIKQIHALKKILELSDHANSLLSKPTDEQIEIPGNFIPDHATRIPNEMMGYDLAEAGFTAASLNMLKDKSPQAYKRLACLMDFGRQKLLEEKRVRASNLAAEQARRYGGRSYGPVVPDAQMRSYRALRKLPAPSSGASRDLDSLFPKGFSADLESRRPQKIYSL